VASIGAHHLKGMGVGRDLSQTFFGTPDAGSNVNFFVKGIAEETKKTNGYRLKGAGQALSETFTAISNSLGVCYFLCNHASLQAIPLEILVKALWATTGIRITPEDLLIGGERVVNIQKAFNSRLGLRREDDTVCNRWMNEPLLEGFTKGSKLGDYLETAKDEYYEYHGWDKKTSLQTRKKLEELDMLDVARVLEKDGGIKDVGG
jgi:aldehyde:ferredoxin oxidoreductase